VKMIALGPSDPIGTAIDTWRKSFGVDQAGEAAGYTLRAAVWEPVLAHLADAKTILVSTDGALGRLPLAALPGKAPGTYLVEDHRLAMIPVPQLLPALVAAAGERSAAYELLLLGDVDYDGRAPTAPTPLPTVDVPQFASLRAPLDGADRFAGLPGTKDEIEGIARLFRDDRRSSTEQIVELAAGEATEARFRRLAPQCRYLHLATHGYFAPAKYRSALSGDTAGEAAGDRQSLLSEEDRESPVAGFSPNLLSGLAFAGANRPPAVAEDDGVMTAEEIACLPLDGVRLATLSACETGLGQTAGGEGLLGLQRAFQVSGVRTTIASYWKVDDQVTRVLMERFYRNIASRPAGEPAAMLDALREAQLWVLRHPQEMAKAAATRGGTLVESGTDPRPRTSPRYWAAFTLSGDWR
jgi:CHAT domain-containing protein